MAFGIFIGPPIQKLDFIPDHGRLVVLLDNGGNPRSCHLAFATQMSAFGAKQTLVPSQRLELDLLCYASRHPTRGSALP